MRNRQSYFKVGEQIVGFTPKVASTSINRALHNMPGRNQAAVRREKRDGKCADVILFVRHPYDRLVSAWWMFSRQNRGSFPKHFEGFVAKVLSRVRHNAEEHWIPQYEYHTYKDQFLPTVLYRFEDIQEIWPVLLPNHPLGWYNRGSNRPEHWALIDELPLEARTELRQYYDADFDLYFAAHHGPVAE